MSRGTRITSSTPAAPTMGRHHVGHLRCPRVTTMSQSMTSCAALPQPVHRTSVRPTLRVPRDVPVQAGAP